MDVSSEPGVSLIHVVDVTDTITALDLEGEFDLNAAPSLVEHAQRVLDSGKNLILNLSDATFIDSSIVHALFRVDAAARADGREFVLQFGTHPGVERVLSLTGAAANLVTATTRSEAIELVEKAARARTS